MVNRCPVTQNECLYPDICDIVSNDTHCAQLGLNTVSTQKVLDSSVVMLDIVTLAPGAIKHFSELGSFNLDLNVPVRQDLTACMAAVEAIARELSSFDSSLHSLPAALSVGIDYQAMQQLRDLHSKLLDVLQKVS